MTLTVISGILMIIGFLVAAFGHDATILFIFSFIIGGFFSAKEGYEELVHERHLNVDVLMILAAIGACVIGNWAEGALLIFIFSLAESLETLAMQKSQSAIEKMMSLAPNTAQLVTAQGLKEVSCDDLQIGDVIQVAKGQTVAIDGNLINEYALINESSVTGESVPVEKQQQDVVYGGTLNEGETIQIRVAVLSKDTLFSRIIKLVEQAQSTPSKTASFIENIEDTYVKIVLFSVPVFIVAMHFLMGLDWNSAFYRGMVLLTVASPCALVASATPATLSAISRATKNHILFKGGITLDKTSGLKAIVFDKTGTLTTGKMTVVDNVYMADKTFVNNLVYSVEQLSTHPIAIALKGHLKDAETLVFEQSQEVVGHGFEVVYQGETYRVGKIGFTQVSNELNADIQALEETGATIIFVSSDTQTLGYFALRDTIKSNAKTMIRNLKSLNIHTVMLTGDQERPAQFVANELGIDSVRANCLPQDKSRIVEELQKRYGSVGMVGDGINDAPALALSDVSFAMGSGSDIALETSDVVLMRDDLSQIPFAIDLSKALKKIIKQNIVFSLSVIAILIVTNILQLISLPLGVVGHEGSTILVILNGLRLLWYK